jgi:diguanylate cyclase (GGDEF)-like protein
VEHFIDNEWNRKVIRLFWWVLVIFEIGAMIGFGFELYANPEMWLYNLTRYQLLPTLAHLVVMGLGYLALHLLKPWQNYIIILWAALLTSVYIATIPELSAKYELMCLPIMLSTLYFRRKMVVCAFLLCYAFVAVLFLVNTSRGDAVSYFEIIVSSAVLTVFAFICYVVMSRGLYLLDTLKESFSREQELLIRSAVIEGLSKTDALTGLLNHRSFQEQTDYLLAHSTAGVPLEMAILDIDNFKSINDTYGHWVGDQVLKCVGEKIRALTGPDDLAFRYGGEEFAIIFVGKTHEEALRECNRLLETIRSMVVTETRGRVITVSIGMAPYRQGMSKSEWFQVADDCLYKAKKSGKDRVLVPA